MNYLKQILAFNDLLEVKPLSSGQISLWHALMCVNNKLGWQEWFTVANRTLEIRTGLARNGVLKARNALKQHGLIDFKFNGTRATAYKIKDLSCYSAQDSVQVGAQDSVQDSVQAGVQDSVQASDTLNKRNINKTKKESGGKAERFTPPTVSEVAAYCKERRNGVSAERFVSFYASKGWMIGKNRMKDWKQAVISWEQRDKKDKGQAFMERDESLEEIRSKIEDPLAEIMAGIG